MKVVSVVLLLAGALVGRAVAAETKPPIPKGDVSFQNEIEHAIERGVRFLNGAQNAEGWWSTPDQPAVTALVLTALKANPKRQMDNPTSDKGYAFLLSCVKPDGGIHRTNLVTYNTSIALLALLAANKPEYQDEILKARRFLAGLQRDFNEKGVVDSPYDGGIGYGSKYEHSDMGNTTQALEALYYSKRLLQDKGGKEPDLNWAAAISFLENCQNLPSHNKQGWASDDAKNKGGFVYYPGHSMAGSETNAVTGRVALRSYGSISYAGLLSYVYADLKKNDPRVQAVLDWLRSNYTLEENPGMGPQGLFYYFHTMAKALSLVGAQQLELTDGRKVDWRREIAMKLLNLQKSDGSWANENARWWEKDAALVSAYSVLTLERVLAGMQAAP